MVDDCETGDMSTDDIERRECYNPLCDNLTTAIKGDDADGDETPEGPERLTCSVDEDVEREYPDHLHVEDLDIEIEESTGDDEESSGWKRFYDDTERDVA